MGVNVAKPVYKLYVIGGIAFLLWLLGAMAVMCAGRVGGFDVEEYMMGCDICILLSVLSLACTVLGVILMCYFAPVTSRMWAGVGRYATLFIICDIVVGIPSIVCSYVISGVPYVVCIVVICAIVKDMCAWLI